MVKACSASKPVCKNLITAYRPVSGKSIHLFLSPFLYRGSLIHVQDWTRLVLSKRNIFQSTSFKCLVMINYIFPLPPHPRSTQLIGPSSHISLILRVIIFQQRGKLASYWILLKFSITKCIFHDIWCQFIYQINPLLIFTTDTGYCSRPESLPSLLAHLTNNCITFIRWGETGRRPW